MLAFFGEKQSSTRILANQWYTIELDYVYAGGWWSTVSHCNLFAHNCRFDRNNHGEAQALLIMLVVSCWSLFFSFCSVRAWFSISHINSNFDTDWFCFISSNFPSITADQILVLSPSLYSTPNHHFHVQVHCLSSSWSRSLLRMVLGGQSDESTEDARRLQRPTQLNAADDSKVKERKIGWPRGIHLRSDKHFMVQLFAFWWRQRQTRRCWWIICALGPLCWLSTPTNPHSLETLYGWLD